MKISKTYRSEWWQKFTPSTLRWTVSITVFHRLIEECIFFTPTRQASYMFRYRNGNDNYVWTTLTRPILTVARMRSKYPSNTWRASGWWMTWSGRTTRTSNRRIGSVSDQNGTMLQAERRAASDQQDDIQHPSDAQTTKRRNYGEWPKFWEVPNTPYKGGSPA